MAVKSKKRKKIGRRERVVHLPDLNLGGVGDQVIQVCCPTSLQVLEELFAQVIPATKASHVINVVAAHVTALAVRVGGIQGAVGKLPMVEVDSTAQDLLIANDQRHGFTHHLVRGQSTVGHPELRKQLLQRQTLHSKRVNIGVPFHQLPKAL